MEMLDNLFTDYEIWLKINVILTVTLCFWRWLVRYVVLERQDRIYITLDKIELISKPKQVAAQSVGLWSIFLAVSWIVLLINWMFF